MQAFEPMINLLVVLTVLSVVAERMTNLVKLNRSKLRMRSLDPDQERDREFSIGLHSVGVGVIVALAMKANFFELVNHLDEPWKTLGWVNVERFNWTRSPATAGPGSLTYTIAGCVLTGAALGFGSKFWHDVLGTVYDIRRRVRKGADNQAPQPTESEGNTESESDSSGDGPQPNGPSRRRRRTNG